MWDGHNLCHFEVFDEEYWDFLCKPGIQPEGGGRLSLLSGLYVGKGNPKVVCFLRIYKINNIVLQREFNFVIENNFCAVNTNVVIDTQSLFGIYLLLFPIQVWIR